MFRPFRATCRGDPVFFPGRRCALPWAVLFGPLRGEFCGGWFGASCVSPLHFTALPCGPLLFEDTVVQELTPLATDRRPSGTCIWPPEDVGHSKKCGLGLEASFGLSADRSRRAGNREVGRHDTIPQIQAWRCTSELSKSRHAHIERTTFVHSQLLDPQIAENLWANDTDCAGAAACIQSASRDRRCVAQTRRSAAWAHSNS